MSLGSMKFEVNSDTGFVTVGYGAGSSPTFTRVLLGNGTTTAPSLAFANDTDTGLFLYGANQMGFAANGDWSLIMAPGGTIYGRQGNNRLSMPLAGGVDLVAGGSNQNISLSPSGNGWVAVPNNNNLQLGLTFGQAVSNASNYFNSGNGAGWVMHFTTGSASYNASNVRLTITDSNLWTPSSINLLLGTNVDSANGRLQLATHTAIAGGIGFGTDTSIWRNFANQLTTSAGTLIGNGGGIGYFSITTTASAPLVLGANGAESVRIDGTTQNAIFSKDILLGTNGPSVPSTLSGRAPRQGLVFDGTSNATMTLGSAIGTGNFTVVLWVNPNATAGTQLLIGDSSGNGSMSLSGANLRWFDLTGGSKTFTSTVTAGKMSMVTIVRSGTTLTSYANAIAGDTHTSAHNLSGTSWVIGGYAGGDKTTGIVGGPTIYNRALTQDELRKLYENGAPDSTDICAAGSQLLTGNNSTFATGQGTWQGINGGSVSAGSGVLTITTTGAYVGGGTENGLVKKGVRYRLVFTLGSYTGALNAVMPFVNTGAILGTGAYSAGTYTIDFTAAVTSYIGFSTANGNTGTFTIDNVTLVPFGAVLAPDAAQTGGGLTWYDTSGNGANITLPASGVSWNVPTSGYYTTTGALNITGGANLILTASTGNLYLRSTTGGAIFDTGAYFLFGTATNSSNGIIQLATHTTAAGGIGFGTDLSLYRQSSTNLYTTALRFASSTAGNFYLATATNSQLVLQTNLTNALIIDTAQNVTTTATLITAASVVGQAGLRLPHGAAPTAPVNGDIWTTTAGLYVRINGVTVGPLT